MIEYMPAQNHQSRGQMIVELLIAISLMALLLPAIISGLISSREGKAQQKQRLDAILLLKEAEEAVRTVRESGWIDISQNGTYHPEISGSNWILVNNEETTNGFNRRIVIDDVYRDITGSIVQSGGTLDPSTKKITSTVSWDLPYLSNINSTVYISRFPENYAYIQTTEEDFNSGTADGTVVTNSNGGEIILGAGGHGSWCAPDLAIASIDLPKQGVANAITAIEGQAFAGTGENASGVSFAEVKISNPPFPTPPAGTINGTFDGYKTNDVFGETNYAYLATDNNSKEIVIIDLTQKDQYGKFSEVGYFNAPGNTQGDSIFVTGNIGFMTASNKLYTFDLSAKTGARGQLGTATLAGTGKSTVVVGNFAYVAVDSSSTQLQIIEISPDGSTLTIVGQASLNGDDGRDVYVNSTATRAYLVTEASSSKREFFIIDITTKTDNRPTIGTYEANGLDPKAVTIVPGNKAIIVGIGGEEYQVINITNENNPTYCGGLQINTGVNGLSSVLESDGDAYSYIITGDATAELKIIEGGPGGQFSSSGTFESATFDTASDETAFNSLTFTADTPFQTNLSFQVAVADSIGGSCDSVTYTYVGPDGTSSSYFTTQGAIPLITSGSYSNPGRCFRYKAYLSTGDITFSPVLYDFSVNYSL